MPVVIVGSGRCGTSMVTRMLALCGLKIGSTFDMFDAANKNNPTGYWEHRAFRQVNEHLLSLMGGNELLPPVFRQDWQFDSSLDPVVEQAKEAIASLSSNTEEWGWKDPRTSLTLPFWQRLIPDLKVIVCVRNPLEVVRSFEDLLKGYGVIGKHLGLSQGYLNWYTYNASVVVNTTSSTRIFSSYEDYFPRFQEPLSNLLKFVGLPELNEGTYIERRVAALHDPALKHHNKTLDDLIDDSSVPSQVKQLYVEILRTLTQPDDSEAALIAASQEYDLASQIDIDHSDQKHIRQIVRDLIMLETKNRRNEAILASRSHRLAEQLCELLIWREQTSQRIKSATADKLNDLIAKIDSQHKLGPMRWY